MLKNNNQNPQEQKPKEKIRPAKPQQNRRPAKQSRQTAGKQQEQALRRSIRRGDPGVHAPGDLVHIRANLIDLPDELLDILRRPDLYGLIHNEPPEICAAGQAAFLCILAERLKFILGQHDVQMPRRLFVGHGASFLRPGPQSIRP